MIFGLAYGFAFDLLLARLAGGVIYELLPARSCLLAPRLDYWLSVCTFLFVAPTILLSIFQWIVNRPWLIGPTTLVGLLLLAS